MPAAKPKVPARVAASQHFKTQMNFRLSDVDRERLRKLSELREVTPAQVLRSLIKEETERLASDE